MPYQVQQIIEGRGLPVCVTRDEPISKALTLIEHDFSQLPVVSKRSDPDYGEMQLPEGMITYEGILRGIRNFRAKIEDLKVRDVMSDAPIFSIEEDLFDILERVKNTNAVLVTRDIGFGDELIGIVTSYDTSEYFRKRTEDLMRVEDIELMVKEFIKMAYVGNNGEVDDTKLNSAISQVTAHKKGNDQSEKQLSFDELTLADYISLMLYKETWGFLEPIFCVQKNFLSELLNGVRETRNALAHFRGDISAEQRDRLKFGVDWLSRRQDEYQKLKEKQESEKLAELAKEALQHSQKPEDMQKESSSSVITDSHGDANFAVTESASGGGRYAALADWLQSQPGRINQVSLTFNQIEEIVGADLPPSARSHRAWWANDSVGHSQSQLWLEAGWRTTYINLGEGKISFSRIREREKAYIAFFSKLLDGLRKKADFPLKDVSPDGASWIVIQTIPSSGPTYGSFSLSFSRDKRLRVELYLDLGDQGQTKAVFDKLSGMKNQIEPQVGAIDWERLDNRRASRIASYHEGYIEEEKGHAELRKWASDTMVKLFNSLSRPAESAILEVKTDD